MNIKNIRLAGAIFTAVMLLLIAALPVSVAIKGGANAENLTLETSAGGTYSWGLKRGSNGSLPTVNSKAAKLLSEYGGKYLGDTSKKTVYLTFDEGYENGYTAQILDVLKENGVKAIFFITGDYLEREPELVERMIKEGHEVGNHTMKHPELATLSDDKIKDEIMSLADALNERFDYTTRLMRPPKGEFNEAVLRVASENGHTNILWSFAYEDWVATDSKGASFAEEKVLTNLHNGAIILLHAVSKDNADALDAIIKGVKEQGYTFGTADELLLSGG